MSEIGSNFVSFLKEHGAVDENGITSLTMKDYKTFLADRGITKEIQAKVAEVETEITTGAYAYVAEKLTEKVKELKKAGKEEEAKKAEASLRLTTPTGSRRVRMVASQTYPIPGTSDKCTKTAVVTDTIKQSRSIDKEVVTKMEEDMKKLLGL